jgi:hypothetical protein
LLLSKSRAAATTVEAAQGEEVSAAVAAPKPAMVFTDEDHLAWIKHLRERRPSNMKRGLTLQQEFELWKQDRLNARAMEMMTVVSSESIAS